MWCCANSKVDWLKQVPSFWIDSFKYFPEQRKQGKEEENKNSIVNLNVNMIRAVVGYRLVIVVVIILMFSVWFEAVIDCWMAVAAIHKESWRSFDDPSSPPPSIYPSLSNKRNSLWKSLTILIEYSFIVVDVVHSCQKAIDSIQLLLIIEQVEMLLTKNPEEYWISRS